MTLLHTISSIFLISLSVAIDWDSVLQADVTCCNTQSDAGECESTYASGGSECVWLEWGISTETDDIITQSGSQCVGLAFYECRTETAGCCVPGCNRPPTESPVSSPASIPTPEPTRICSKNEPYSNCVLGGNYAFEGVPCQINGDPHTKTFNGGHHDFQGQPLSTNDDDEEQNQFYYIAPCSDSSPMDLPFTVIGTHFNFGNRITTGLDYLTLELHDGIFSRKPDYYLFLSSSIMSYADATADGVTTNYDDTLADDDGADSLIEITAGSATSIGSRFVANITSDGVKTTSLVLTIDSMYNLSIYMKGQAALEETDSGDYRYRMHYVYIDQDSAYKCASCGLCGNFKDDYNESSSSQEFEICDGSMVEYRSGISDDALENFGQYGWTYEYNYWNDYCDVDSNITLNYDMGASLGSFNWTAPCDSRINKSVIAACAIARASQTRCCSMFEDVCDELQSDCETDVCIMSTEDGVGNKSLIDGYVNSTLTQSIVELCSIPDVADAFAPVSLLEYAYAGCWKTNYTNPTMNYTRLNLESAGECIEHCWEKGFDYAAVMNATNLQCFCTSDKSEYQEYGTSNLCEDGVGYYAVSRDYDRTTQTTTTTYIAAFDVYAIGVSSVTTATPIAPTSKPTMEPTLKPSSAPTTTTTSESSDSSETETTESSSSSEQTTTTTSASSESSERETTESSSSSEETTSTTSSSSSSVEYEEEGCYLENYTNPSINYTRMNLDSAIECIEHCNDKDYEFAAVLNATNFQCFCSNDESDFETLGTSSLCEDGVGYYAVERTYDRTTMTTTTKYIAALSVYKITSSSESSDSEDLDVLLLQALTDGEHVRGQDWRAKNGDIDLSRLVGLEQQLKEDSEHIRGQDWDGHDVAIDVDALEALEKGDDMDHIRGQDWEGEDERELIVAHGEMVHTVSMEANQWTLPFIVLVGALTVCSAMIMWRWSNDKKWAKDNYVPISDGSDKTSHLMYV